MNRDRGQAALVQQALELIQNRNNRLVVQVAQNNLLRKHIAQRTHVNHAGAGLCLVAGRAVPHDRAGKANLTGGLQHRIVIAAVRRAEVGLRRDTEDAHNLVLVAL